MRTYTLVFSIVVHAAVACTMLFSTVLATDELPEPRRASVFVDVFPTPLPSPPPVRPRVVQPSPVAVIPTEAPVGIQPELERPLALDAFEVPPTDGVVGGLGSADGVLRDDPPPPPPPPVVSGPVRVGGDVRPPQKVVHVAPVYPGIALSSRVSGAVILEATIGEDGRVREVRVLKSYPLLDQAAIDAVRQWRYTPTLLNGRPVSVLMTVTVAFNLQ
jgi:periplasmic protein TonB